MDEVRDVAGISIPFTAGTAAGFWMADSFLRETLSPSILSSASLIFTAAFIFLAVRNRGLAWFSAAYFATGLFCASASSAGIALIPDTGTGIAARCSSALKGLIDDMPFRSPDSGAVVKALLTGDRSGLSSEYVRIFRQSGASHILALSGLHLGIIYLIISNFFTIFGNSITSRKLRCLLVCAAAGFYTLMTGAGPSIVRAFLFICIRELSGISSGRQQGAARTLLICLTVQLAISPQVMKSVGFQLSYLAMCGIVTILPVMQSWYPEAETRMGRLDPMRWIWNAASLAISCQIFTAPLSWLRFHSFPRYFLITNISALPLATLIMFLSVVTVILHAAGICPEILVMTDERLISILTGVLETICSM